MVIEPDNRARRFAAESALIMGKDSSHMPGAGAAGGLGYGPSLSADKPDRLRTEHQNQNFR